MLYLGDQLYKKVEVFMADNMRMKNIAEKVMKEQHK